VWNNIKVSLYDLFGYFFPGAIFSIALVILFWALFFPARSVLPFTIAKPVAVILLVIAYLAGHIVQAVANRTCRSKPRVLETMKEIPAEIRAAVRKEIETYVPEASKLKEDWIHSICDAVFTRIGSIDNKVIYEAREGLYKGLFVSFAALSISLLARMLVPGAKIEIQSSVIEFRWPFLLALGVLSLAACPLLYLRYKRFARYKNLESVLGFLAASKFAPDKKDKEES
jgi:hypothetical protein